MTCLPKFLCRLRLGWPLAGALLALVLAATPAAAAPPRVTVTLAGEAEVVFDWARDACATWDVPDAPARAFRDAAGAVRLFAAHHEARAFVGRDLDHLRHDCAVAFAGGHDDAPQAFDDRAWLAGFFTADGQTVHALVHNEFHGHVRRALCPAGVYMRCWRNAITVALSRDGGRRFTEPEPPAHLVATPPYPYDGALGRHVGYFNPTNILRGADGFLYAMFSATAYGAQAAGACVMRTDRIADPAAWRAWDGTGFTVRFADPYRDRIADPAAHVCAPVGQGRLITPLGGLLRHAPSGAYVLVMAGTRHGTAGVYAAASWDLVDWSEPSLVWRAPVRPNDSCPSQTVDYPALLDPASTDRNFATAGDTAQLYVTRHHLKDCGPSPRRDLVRRPVRIAVTEGAP